MRAILVLVGLGGIAYGALVLLITLGLASQVDPALTGAARRAAVGARLLGNLRVGLIMGVVGLLAGVGLIVYARFFAPGEEPGAPGDDSDTGQGDAEGRKPGD